MMFKKRYAIFSHLIALGALVVLSVPAVANSFVVTTHLDTSDINPGDGVAEDIDGNVSLRAAIEEANALAGEVTILFDSELDFPLTITLEDTLVVEDSLTILVTEDQEVILFGDDSLRLMTTLGAFPTLILEGISFVGGNANLSNSVEAEGGALYVHNLELVELRRCVFRGNRADSRSNALQCTADRFIAVDCVFEENLSGDFGADDRTVGVRGEAEVTRCAFLNNESRGALVLSFSEGAVIRDSVFIGNTGVFYSALRVTRSSATVRNCLFSENTGTLLGGTVAVYDGELTMVNSTFSGNTSEYGGGAVYASGESVLTLINCTLTNNSSALEDDTGVDGGGIGQNTVSEIKPVLMLGNTIVAGNMSVLGQPDVHGPIVSLGGNLIGVGDGSSGYVASDLVGSADAPVQPLLAPLQMNGGPTPSHALLPDSQAIDLGISELIAAPNFEGPPFHDQRGEGFVRITGEAVDCGAFELQVREGDLSDLAQELLRAFDVVDTDASGGLSLEETEAAAMPLFPAELMQLDRDGDEELSRPELILATLVGETHSADQGQDGAISLSELLRVIQFFNSNGYHCDAAGEDGFAPTPGGQMCLRHAADITADFVISLSELLRVVQFFNSGGYHFCPDALTEDGFCPGAP